MRKLAGLIFLTLSLISFTVAQIPEHRDATELGLAAGSVAPHFSLPDQSGKQRSIASLAGPKGLVLVFLRSADW